MPGIASESERIPRKPARGVRPTHAVIPAKAGIQGLGSRREATPNCMLRLQFVGIDFQDAECGAYVQPVSCGGILNTPDLATDP